MAFFTKSFLLDRAISQFITYSAYTRLLFNHRSSRTFFPETSFPAKKDSNIPQSIYFSKKLLLSKRLVLTWQTMGASFLYFCVLFQELCQLLASTAFVNKLYPDQTFLCYKLDEWMTTKKALKIQMAETRQNTLVCYLEPTSLFQTQNNRNKPSSLTIRIPPWKTRIKLRFSEYVFVGCVSLFWLWFPNKFKTNFWGISENLIRKCY